jgi:inhibitor of KinA sporulation pathway (predicted exonuclease)
MPDRRSPYPHRMGSAARLLNVIDVEATCWAGNPPPGQVNEIIEIGLTVFDTIAGVRVNRRRILVRPRHSSVSAFCADPDRSDPS